MRRGSVNKERLVARVALLAPAQSAGREIRTAGLYCAASEYPETREVRSPENRKGQGMVVVKRKDARRNKIK